jgi:hypothetical protein
VLFFAAATTRLDLAQVLADLCLGLGTAPEDDAAEEARMEGDLDMEETIEEIDEEEEE